MKIIGLISITKFLRDYLHFRVVLCQKTSVLTFRLFIICDQGSLAVSKCRASGVSVKWERSRDKAHAGEDPCQKGRRLPFY